MSLYIILLVLKVNVENQDKKSYFLFDSYLLYALNLTN